MTKKLKLHLGCGSKFIPGFKHMDVVERDHIDFVGDIKHLKMFKTNSVDLIYASHVLEHFKRNEIDSVLKEWNRVLKVGGILRISVPGFEELIEIYRRYSDIKLILGPLVGGQTYLYNYHYMIFDFKLLKEFLINAGFRKIYKWDYSQTEHSQIDDYSQAFIPHMDKENGMPVSLNVEAVK